MKIILVGFLLLNNNDMKVTNCSFGKRSSPTIINSFSGIDEKMLDCDIIE
jgi:hypothetical protein